MKFRPDIQGLRGIAVLGVFLFHLGIQAVPGGYVGVDIFFVISGFLITGIIAEDIRAGRFSFAQFYNRRMKRILPVFQLVGLTTLLAGWFLFLPTSLLVLLKSLIASSLFASNIYFWKETTGYFGTASEELPLLHNWSLSVEEQFYMLWPLTLVLMLRYIKDRRWVVLAIGVTVLATIALAELNATERATAAYFLLPTRAGEFLIGALLVFMPQARTHPRPFVNQCLAVIGLILLLASNVLLHRYSRFPGINALWPCVGAALVIATGRGEKTVVSSLLGFKPLAFIGTISYSLYLWHWPPIAFLHYFGIEITGAYKLGIFCGVLALSYVSWRFVEETLRRVEWRLPKTVFAFSVALLLVQFGALGFVQSTQQEFAGLGETVGLPANCPEGMNATDYPAACLLGDKAKAPSFALWGDSFAGVLWKAIDDAAIKDGASGYALTLSMCPSIAGVVWNDAPLMPDPLFAKTCSDFDASTLDFIVGHPNVETVVITSNYFWYLTARNPEGEPILSATHPGASTADEFKGTLQRLAAAGKRVIVVMPHPSDKDQFNTALRRAVVFGRTASLTTPGPGREPDPITAMVESVAPTMDLARIYPDKLMCDADHCRVFDEAGDLYLSDGAHLTAKTARIIVAKFPRHWEHGHHDRTGS